MTQETIEEYIKEVTKNFGDEMSINFTSGGIKLGAKWQADRMYSEEEVKQMLIDCCGEVSCEDGVLVGKTPVELYKWIDEQFKKK